MKRLSPVHLTVIAVVACVSGPSTAAAQDSPVVNEPNMIRRAFSWAQDRMQNGSGEAKDGFYPQLGGMVPGAGWISAGPGYRRHLFGDAAVIDVSAAMSWRRYSTIESRIDWPRLLSDRLSIGVGAKYQDFTQISYFGVGPDSFKEAETNYRLKNVDVSGSATVRPTDRLSIGGRVGYIHRLDITPGLSSARPPTHDVFDDATAPGLTVQPRYGHANLFVEADTRDVPGYPAHGGVYRIGLAAFHDLDGSGQSFRRVEGDAIHYTPLLRRNWIAAVRGHVALSQTSAGNEVPFYLMPTLGGRNTLRGYDDYRFRDRNAASIGVEYQIPILHFMDAAVFGDAGSVGPTASSLWRQRPDYGYGFGVRFHSETRSVARIDLAQGREGKRVSMSLTTSLGRSSANVLPYVP